MVPRMAYSFQYALSTDARQASTQWVEKIETRLFTNQRREICLISGQKVVIVAPGKFSGYQAEARKTGTPELRIARSVNDKYGLLAGIDRLFSGWITELTRFLDADNHVSRGMN